MKKKIIIFCLATILSVNLFSNLEFAMGNNVYAAQISSSDSEISPLSDSIGWIYKTENGKIYKRLYNYTTNQYIGSWILVS